jgi:DnaJ-class molecular chaperone
LETPSGIQAAWTFISNPDNAAQYDQFEVEQFKNRVQQAARQKGVSLR